MEMPRHGKKEGGVSRLSQSDASNPLVRGIGLPGAIALNVINMVGVGPFITLPLIVLAMHGNQAILAWILAAGLAACDGLVWAELGAAMPRAGGSYWYLRTIYGPERAGRFLSFLYIWQLTFSAPLSIASGCVGLAQYAGYLFPVLRETWFSYRLPIPVPFARAFSLTILIGPGTLVAMAACAAAAALLFRNIRSVARGATWLWCGVMAALLMVIVAGLSHFHPQMAFGFSPHTFAPSRGFLTGLGAAMLIATYDYWGAYSVNFLGGEVRDPGRTIPRAILLSVGVVAVLYLLMNTSVLGLIPWSEFAVASNARYSVASVVVGRTFGPVAAKVVTVLILWTAFASVYALLLSYSRVPYAAALDGNYFRIFSRFDSRHGLPAVSLLALAAVAMLFCTLQLADLVAALVVIRILLQFVLQHIGVMVLRHTHPEMERPFRIWLYPLPPLLAIAGFLYVLFARPGFAREIYFAAILVVTGSILYLVRSGRRREWPFAEASDSEIKTA